MKRESFVWERANVALLRPATAGLGPLELVPLHSPRPLRYPLWGLRIGGMRTRAIAPAYPGHSLRDGVTFRFRGGIQRALTRILDWETQVGE